jgi:hypothetical protein
LEARVRGLLALGYYGRPGTEVALGQVVRATDRTDRERMVAAYALGLLSDEQCNVGFEEVVKPGAGSGFKRDRLPLLGFLLALSSSSHPLRAAVLRQILQDDSSRDPLVARLALRALARSDCNLTAKEIESALGAKDPDLRIEMLSILARATPTAEEARRVEQLAGYDSLPLVRAQALRTLVSWRRPTALELSAKALKASDPNEAAAGIEGCLVLAGGYAKDAAEAVLLRATKPEVRTLLYGSWHGALTKPVARRCSETIADRKEKPESRLAAAELLAEAADPRAKPALYDLFFEVSQQELMVRAAAALSKLEAAGELASRVRSAGSSRDRELIAARIAALLRTHHPEAHEIAHEALDDPRISHDDHALVLRALALAAVKPAELGLATRISDGLVSVLR